MSKTKKQLRIQLEPGSSKGKTKPPTLIVWDGIQDPLPIIQRRLKTVNSLRNKQTDEEYTIVDLRSLSDKEIIKGSSKESALPASAPASAPLAASAGGGPVELLTAQLQNGLSLSKHARDRMHERKISQEQVEKCYREGKSYGQDGATVYRDSNVEMIVVDKTVQTVIATFKESYPFPSDRALYLRKAGIFQALREELEIRIWYDEHKEAFELNGHEDGIKRAKFRLERLLKQEATTIRIKSPNDTCSLVIGKQGSTINGIRNICGITQSLTIRWDKNEGELILTSAFLLNDTAKTKLQICVGDVIARRPLSTFETEEDPEANHPKAKNKRVKRNKHELVKDAYKDGGSFNLQSRNRKKSSYS